MTSFHSHARRYPPILCRLLARRRFGPPLTVEEIAARGRLTVLEVNLLSEQTQWDTVMFGGMTRFLTGCGIDFTKRADMKRIDSYIRSKPTWKYLRNSGLWTSLYEPMLKKYAQSRLATR